MPANCFSGSQVADGQLTAATQTSGTDASGQPVTLTNTGASGQCDRLRSVAMVAYWQHAVRADLTSPVRT
jgi:hypothetical protein